jgi:hypothetical protein
MTIAQGTPRREFDHQRFESISRSSRACETFAQLDELLFTPGASVGQS